MFIGREEELKILENLFQKGGASLVVCTGRRRIGKSTLIQQIGKKADVFFEFQGLPPRPGLRREDQLKSFAEQLAHQTRLPVLPFASWAQALGLLAEQVPKRGRTVIFLDEISWMAEGDPDFAGQLKILWDTKFKTKDKLILVLCGSVSSWIENNISRNAGYVGRVSLKMDVGPLGLPHCLMFWGPLKNRISSLDVLKMLSVTGGVPRYLEEINPREEAETNIHRLCFQPEGLLFSEFSTIFNDIFVRRSETYKHIVTALSLGAKTLNGIAQFMKTDRGGGLTRYLHDLEMSGFIRKEKIFRPGRTDPTKSPLYRISDNYLRFYLTHIEPRRENILKGLYRQTPIHQLLRWDVVLGLQFETLVLNQFASLCPILSIPPGQVISASPYVQRRTQRETPCQIDLLIQTRHSVYVCEVKCRRHIDRDVIDEVKAKVAALRLPRGISVRTVLLYEGSLNPRLAEEGYFDFLIPFSRLLELPGSSTVI